MKVMSAACALSPSALDTSYSLGKRSRSGEEDYYAQAKRTRQFSSSGLQARRAALAALQNLYPSMAERVRSVPQTFRASPSFPFSFSAQF